MRDWCVLWPWKSYAVRGRVAHMGTACKHYFCKAVDRLCWQEWVIMSKPQSSNSITKVWYCISSLIIYFFYTPEQPVSLRPRHSSNVGALTGWIRSRELILLENNCPATLSAALGAAMCMDSFAKKKSNPRPSPAFICHNSNYKCIYYWNFIVIKWNIITFALLQLPICLTYTSPPNFMSIFLLW